MRRMVFVWLKKENYFPAPIKVKILPIFIGRLQRKAGNKCIHKQHYKSAFLFYLWRGFKNTLPTVSTEGYFYEFDCKFLKMRVFEKNGFCVAEKRKVFSSTD
ncbi:hypothetical protein [Flavobacterium micromati]|uniref:hypothetical protein n=1 Tax=Flavobacterium micromati TaxID=229205 RepID=UPI001114E369|nr:hypothetical protein [Flavobacterium micromati]